MTDGEAFDLSAKYRCRNDLKHQDHRDTDGKFGVLCFMPEEVHSDKGAKTAANDGGAKERPLRDAPKFFSRSVLVRQHKQKAQCIDCNEIEDDRFHKIPFRGEYGMKKMLCLVMLCVLLAGCAAEETFETVADAYVQPVDAIRREIYLSLPENTAEPTFTSETAGKLWLCDGFTASVCTMEAGNVDATVRAVSGYGADDLILIETEQNTPQLQMKRLDFVWCSAGEGGNQIGRAAILDDGNYHYVLSCMAPETLGGELRETWDQVFASFQVA